MRREAGGDAGEMDVRVAKSGLSAGCSVYALQSSGFDGLVDFFRAMADDWRGWPGKREWASLEGELAIAAVHDGHVRMTIVLRTPVMDWHVIAQLSLDPGEELSAVARDLAELLS